MATRLPLRPIIRCYSCSFRLFNFFTITGHPQRSAAKLAINSRISTSTSRRPFSCSTAVREAGNKEGRNLLPVLENGPQEAVIRDRIVWRDLNYLEDNREAGNKEERDLLPVLENGPQEAVNRDRIVWRDLNYLEDNREAGNKDEGTLPPSGPQEAVIRDRIVWRDLKYIEDEREAVPRTTKGSVWGQLKNIVMGQGRLSRNLNYVSLSTLGISPTVEAKGDGIIPHEERGSESQSTASSAVPWYLQDSYATKSSLIPERDPLPSLPENSPGLLAFMLAYLDADLGISDFRILDLRSLDPAPALGSDIIMVFGSARSQRHLHTAADRFCRWMRSEHHIHPIADGLLGRNARKLITRRRRRRGLVASSQVGEVSEMTQTEWVCVNSGYEGLIFQLFTPSRRKELNLEALWERKLDTNRKNLEKMAMAAETGQTLTWEDLYRDDEEVFGEEVEKVTEKPVKRSYGRARTKNTASIFPFRTGSSFPKTQTRALHISRNRDPQLITTPSTRRESLKFISRQLPITYQEMMHVLPPGISKFIVDGDYGSVVQSFQEYYPEEGYKKSITQAAILFAHVHHLQILPLEAACEALGNHAFDTGSTPFLRSFFQEIPAIPAHIHYHAWLSFLIQGHSIKPSAYPVSCFREFIIQIKASGVEIPVAFYTAILDTLATTPELRQNRRESADGVIIRQTTRRMREMVKLVEDMARSSGYDINIPEVYTALTRGLLSNDIDAYHRLALDVCEIPGAARRNCRALQFPKSRYAPDRRMFLLEQLMKDYKVKQNQPEYYIHALIGFAACMYWPAFWNRWNEIHYQAASRGREMYKLVLGLISMAENQNEAVNCLRSLKTSMGREYPSTRLDVELARGFLAVMDVAGGADGRYGVGAEYHSLRMRCEDLVQEDSVV